MRYFGFRARSRRLLLVGAAVSVVVLAGTAAIAYAAYPTNSVQVMTGCLTTSGTGAGNIVNTGIGGSPTKACGSNQTLVHLSGGTITQVTAGNGLGTTGSGGTDTGGSPNSINNGWVTLGLLPGFSLPQNCSSGQVAKSSGSNSWACANDLNTSYSNGTGLDLASGAFSIDPTYQLPQSCSDGQVAKWDNTNQVWTCANDQNTTYNGTNFATSGQDCPAHQFATGIDANGNLKCAQPTVNDLNGSACTFNGHTSTLAVSTDSTTGAVSMKCQPVYEVSVTVTGGAMSWLRIKDFTASTIVTLCLGQTFCSGLVPAGHQVQTEILSGSENTGGGSPFTYTCPAGDFDAGPHTAIAQPGITSGTYYSGGCNNLALSGDEPITVSFTG